MESKRSESAIDRSLRTANKIRSTKKEDVPPSEKKKTTSAKPVKIDESDLSIDKSTVYDRARSSPGQEYLASIARRVLGITQEEWTENDLVVTDSEGGSAGSVRLIQVTYDINRTSPPPPRISAMRGRIIAVGQQQDIGGGSTYTHKVMYPDGVDTESFDGYCILTDMDGQKHVVPMPDYNQREGLLPLQAVYKKVYGDDDASSTARDLDRIEVDDHKITQYRTLWRPNAEGNVLQIVLYDGKAYLTSHRRLDASRSTYGSNRKWIDYWTEDIGAPDPSLFYPPGVRHSPYVFRFLLCYKEKVSSGNMREVRPYLTFLGVVKMWEPTTFASSWADFSGFSNDPVDASEDYFVGFVRDEDGNPTDVIGDRRTVEELLDISKIFGDNILITEDIVVAASTGGIFYPRRSLSWEKCKKLITTGYSDKRRANINDPLSSRGECIMVSWRDLSGYVRSARIFSQSTYKRMTICGGGLVPDGSDPIYIMFSYIDMVMKKYGSIERNADESELSREFTPSSLKTLYYPDDTNQRLSSPVIDAIKSDGAALSRGVPEGEPETGSLLDLIIPRMLTNPNPDIRRATNRLAEFIAITYFIRIAPLCRRSEFSRLYKMYYEDLNNLRKYCLSTTTPANSPNNVLKNLVDSYQYSMLRYARSRGAVRIEDLSDTVIENQSVSIFNKVTADMSVASSRLIIKYHKIATNEEYSNKVRRSATQRTTDLIERGKANRANKPKSKTTAPVKRKTAYRKKTDK